VSVRPADRLEAGIIGRTLRLMLAMLLALMTYTVLRTEGKEFSVHLTATLGGVIVAYVGLHLVLRRYGAGLRRWYGALGVLAPLILGFAFGGLLGRAVVSAYLGLAFALQALRGDGGAEALALPAALLRRPTRFPGILFAPIDLVEKHLTGPGGLPG
jgi:hypothetical protein